MEDKLFESYYKRGIDHFVFRKLMNLKKPKRLAQQFYFGLMGIIILFSMIFG
jgi:hypothetical protein